MLRTTISLVFLLAVPVVGAPSPVAKFISSGGDGEAKITKVGFGTPGLGGTLELSIAGAPVVGQPFAWRVDNGAPGAIGFLLISGDEVVLPLPEFGGEFYVGLPQLRKRFTINAQGTKKGLFKQASLDPSLSGLQVISQALVFDAAAQGGLNLTAGLRLLLGAPASLGDDFEQPVPFPHGKCDWMEFAELDGDGLVDRLLLNDAGDLAFSPGLGDGTFGALVTQSLSLANPDELRLRDVDNDGELDLIATDWGFPEDTLSVFLGLGGGVFGAEIELTLPVRPADLALPDLNDDGILDAAMITTAGTILTTLGVGDGRFGAIQTTDPGLATIGLSDRGIDQADFDGDGRDDVVIAMNFPGVLAWFSSDGLGGLGAAQMLASGDENILDVHVADFNADGDADVVATSRGGIHVAEGDGVGGFAVELIYEGSVFGLDIFATDVTGDGNLDLVTTRTEDLALFVGVLGGNGDTTFEPIQDVSIGPAFSVRLVDADQDGDLDFHGIVQGGLIEKRTVGGAFNFGPMNLIPNPSIQAGFSVIYGDFDSDGIGDVVLNSFSSPNSHLFVDLGAANPPAPTTLTVPIAANNCEVADLNGDGALDLLLVGSQPNYGVMAYLGDGQGGFGSAIPSPLAPLGFSCELGDFDEDGIPDLATRTNDNIIKIWRGTGTGSFTFLSQQPIVFDFGLDLHVADFNADGFLDVGAYSDVNNLFQVLLGQGDGTLPTTLNTAVGNAIMTPTVHDENEDGIPDLVYRESGDLSVRLGLGDGLFAAGYTIPVDDTPISWTWADLNEDGLDDLVTLRSTVPALFWIHPSNGDGTYGPSRAFLSDSGAILPMIEDVNGDGLLDLVTVNRRGVRVILHE